MKSRINTPNIVKGLDDSTVTIVYPKDPIQIGVAKDGKPIWIDPKDFILTPDQKVEQRENMDKDEAEKALHNARLSIAARVEMWLALTMAKLLPASCLGNQEQTEAWIKEHDVNYIEDNSKEGVHRFVLRFGTKVISEFIAKIQPKP